MKTSNEIGAIAKALAAAQAKMQNPRFDSQNPHFRSKFASLAAVRDAVIPVMAEHGISVTQELTSTESGAIACTTILMHESGQWLAYGPLAMRPVKDDPQGRGSASTYAKRYSLQAVAGVVGDEDDDGEAAQSRGKVSPTDHGETLTAREKADAESLAKDIRAALDADQPDEEIARRCVELQMEARENAVVYTEAWRQLDSKTRSAFKKYLKLAEKEAA